jgi:hypothetical protein
VTRILVPFLLIVFACGAIMGLCNGVAGGVSAWSNKTAGDQAGAAILEQEVPTPAGDGQVSEEFALEMVEKVMQHDERMTDKVVEVAVSGDKAQTITAVSGDWSAAVLPLAAAFAAVVAVFMVLTGKGRGGE